MHYQDDFHTYIDYYTLELPKGVNYSDIVHVLSEHKNITQVNMENVGGSANFS